MSVLFLEFDGTTLPERCEVDQLSCRLGLL